jgi:hypothetical protein
MSESYFLGKLSQIENNLGKLPSRILILTDAPQTEVYYSPPSNQVGLWEDTPSFREGIMHVHANVFPALMNRYPDLRIISGGDPIDALKIMSQADYLIMSRSSLSYLGALLNRNGTIFFPPDFWHKPLKGWKK